LTQTLTVSTTSNQPECKLQKKKIIPKIIPNSSQIIQLTPQKKRRCSFKKRRRSLKKNRDVVSKKIRQLTCIPGGDVNSGDEGGIRSLVGRPCFGEDAIHRLGQLKFEDKGDGFGGVAAVREKERDVGEERAAQAVDADSSEAPRGGRWHGTRVRE